MEYILAQPDGMLRNKPIFAIILLIAIYSPLKIEFEEGSEWPAKHDDLSTQMECNTVMYIVFPVSIDGFVVTAKTRSPS